MIKIDLQIWKSANLSLDNKSQNNYKHRQAIYIEIWIVGEKKNKDDNILKSEALKSDGRTNKQLTLVSKLSRTLICKSYKSYLLQYCENTGGQLRA